MARGRDAGFAPCAPRPMPLVQRKARLGDVNDAAEREADVAAARVTRGLPARIASSGTPVAGSVQRSHIAGATSSKVASAVDAVASGGAPLDAAQLSYFEPRFGHDLKGVRIHSDARAQQAAASIGARAFTYGSSIAFGSGESSSGLHNPLLAHELAHPVQQSRGVVRRQETAADPEMELGKKLRTTPEFSDGYSLAFFDPDFDLIPSKQPMTQTLADAFASREQGIGIRDEEYNAASLTFGKSIRGTKTDGTSRIQDVVPKLAGVVNSALAKVPAATPPAAGAGPGPAKIKAIAIFAHGTPSWCSLNVTSGNAPGIFKAIAPYLSNSVRVILYTCSSAKGVTENLGSDKEEVYKRGSLGKGGTDSLAAVVRDTLVDAGVGEASVWGHTGAGHPTQNWSLRFFSAKEGKGTAGHGFVGYFMMVDPVIKMAGAALAAEIGRQGYMVDAADPKFAAAAQPMIADGLYRAYAQLHWDKSLPVKPAEYAPLHSAGAAMQAIEHFENNYWPKLLPTLAKALINSLGLKKLPATPPKP